MSEWKDINRDCEHCGKPLEARPKIQGRGYVISGFEPMEYRHKHNGEPMCVIQRRNHAKPYTECNAYKDWRSA